MFIPYTNVRRSFPQWAGAADGCDIPTVFASSDFAVNSFYYFLSKAGLFSAKLSLTTNVSGNDVQIF